MSVTAPGRSRTLKDGAYGNESSSSSSGPDDCGKTVEMRFSVKRKEKAAYAADAPRRASSSQPERLVPASENFANIAEEVARRARRASSSGRAPSTTTSSTGCAT